MRGRLHLPTYQTKDAVLALQMDGHAGGDQIGSEGRHADTEVDCENRVELGASIFFIYLFMF